jgi:hypothetical protein
VVRYSTALDSNAANGTDTISGFAAGDQLDFSAMVSAYSTKVLGTDALPQVNQLAVHKDSKALASVGDNQFRWWQDAATGTFKAQFDTNPAIGTPELSAVMDIRGITPALSLEALSNQTLSFQIQQVL